MQLTKLGPYEILKPVGKGGMGSVYEAIDAASGDRVAVKALNPQLALAEGFRERFEAEIESLKALRHEGIVRLYGYGEQDGILFYSMELVDGTSLEDEIKAGRRFQWREVTDIAIQLCLALKHAHDHGVVHRDIKPANILVTSDERVKLADFGIARLFGSTQLTTAGGVLGTADYMAPEQADGRPITARCDQYSLGGVLYALLAGRPPFRAKTLPEMLQYQRFAEPEPVRRYADQTPEQLERVILQLLSKNPDDRFPNMQVLARHLQAMVRALSRPTADSFTLAGEGLGEHSTTPNLSDSLSLAATRADVDPRVPAEAPADPSPSKGNSTAGWSHEAATMSEEELAAGPEGEAIAAALPETKVLPPQRPPATAPARFTTLEEEEARRRAQHVRPWTAVAAQLLGLVLVLGGLVGLAYYLSRPASADDLYETITSQADEENPESIREVDREIEEFLERFPNDPRAAELRQYAGQLLLDRAERQLQLRARRNGLADPALMQVESLYLQAMAKSHDSPAEAAALLDSLVKLYGADATADVTEDSPEGRQAICVELARRELAKLNKTTAEQSARQLAELRERLAAAEAIAASDPAGAAAMYRAIVDLYHDQPWAAEAVAEARQKLDTKTSETATP